MPGFDNKSTKFNLSQIKFDAFYLSFDKLFILCSLTSDHLLRGVSADLLWGIRHSNQLKCNWFNWFNMRQIPHRSISVHVPQIPQQWYALPTHWYKSIRRISLPSTEGDGPNCPWHGSHFHHLDLENASPIRQFSGAVGFFRRWNPSQNRSFPLNAKFFGRNATVNKYIAGDVIRTNNLQYTRLVLYHWTTPYSWKITHRKF